MNDLDEAVPTGPRTKLVDIKLEATSLLVTVTRLTAGGRGRGPRSDDHADRSENQRL